MMSKDRPLRFLTGVGGIRDIIVGAGFLTGSTEVTSLQLYINFNSLLVGAAAPLVGWLFLIAGIVALLAAVKDWPVLASRALWVQSFLWLFSGWMYLLSGDLFHSIVFGYLFSIPAAYIAIHYKWKASWIQEQAELRRELAELRKLIRGP